MAEWICLLHPPRDNFAATMTDEERAAFEAAAPWRDRWPAILTELGS